MKHLLILGISGMLGNKLYNYFSKKNDTYITYGTLRKKADEKNTTILSDVDAFDEGSVKHALELSKPDYVINCIGIIKQLPEAKDPIVSITVNSLFPHKLAMLCKNIGARLIHISTDCVFSGKKGNYAEDDQSDAEDLYGKSKYLGEIRYPHTVTLRTSIIGHEIRTCNGLVEWFLSQDKAVDGYSRSFFSGLPTIEIAKIVDAVVIPNQLSGLYHVSAERISKYDLLQLISKVYGKDIIIKKDETHYIDRSLNSSRFIGETGYKKKAWPLLISDMYDDYMEEKNEHL